MMFRSAGLAAGVALTLALCATAARADTATIQFNSGALYMNGSSSVGYYVNPPGYYNTTSGTTGAGGFAGYLNGSPTPTYFWCSDLYDGLTYGPATYNVSILANGSTPSQWTQTLASPTPSVDQLNALLYNGQNYIASQGTSGAKTTASAALQVAVWAFLYNGTSASVSSTSNIFYLTSYSTAVRDTANNFLSCVFSGTVTGVCNTGWTANSSYQVASYTRSGNQSFVSLVGTTGGGGDVVSTPEPATSALMLAGIAGLGALRRRRRRG